MRKDHALGVGNDGRPVSLRSEVWKQRMEEKRLTAGLVGRIFGTGPSAPRNIAGLAVLAAMAIGGFHDPTARTEIWTFTTPIITCALGYLFGRGQTDS